jgi:hypothetical protein
MLAARPATPAQLANACLAGGYSAAVPASWGDELIAAAALERLASRGDGAVVLCACPRVVERLRRVPALAESMLSFVAPAVAAARYLRARAGTAGLTITYIGDCPGAVDPSIDRVATPAALMRSLARRGIVIGDQPLVVDPRVARDGRRFYSLPGGVPAPNWILAEGRGDHVIEPSAVDYVAEIAHRASARDRSVIDLAPRLGCACSGAVRGTPWPTARAAVAAVEPPRAVHEVLDHDVRVDVSYVPAPWQGSSSDGVRTDPTSLTRLAAQHAAERAAPAARTAALSAVLPSAAAAPIVQPPTGAVTAVGDTASSGPASGAPPSAGSLVAPGDAAWPARDRRRWDGVERRRGWVNGRPAGWVDPAAVPVAALSPASTAVSAPRTSTGVVAEPRTGPLRQQHTFIRVPAPPIERRRMLGIAVVSSAIVAATTTVATLHFVFGVHATVSVPRLLPRPSARPVASTVVRARDSVASPAADDADDADAGVTPEAPATDEAATDPPAADAPDAARIAPPAPSAQSASLRAAARRWPRRSRVADPGPRDPANRATVVAPGAAPIPRVSTPEPVAPAAAFPIAPQKRGAIAASSAVPPTPAPPSGETTPP